MWIVLTPTSSGPSLRCPPEYRSGEGAHRSSCRRVNNSCDAGNVGDGAQSSYFLQVPPALSSFHLRNASPQLCLALLLLVATQLHPCLGSAEVSPVAVDHSVDDELGYRHGFPAWSESDKSTEPVFYPSWNNGHPPGKRRTAGPPRRSSLASSTSMYPSTSPQLRLKTSSRAIAGMLGLAVILSFSIWSSHRSRERSSHVLSVKTPWLAHGEPSRSRASEEVLAKLAATLKSAEAVQPHVVNSFAAMDMRLRRTFTTAKGAATCNELAEIVITIQQERNDVFRAPVYFLTADSLDEEVEVTRKAASTLEQMSERYDKLLKIASDLTDWASTRATQIASEVRASWRRVNDRIEELKSKGGQLCEDDEVLSTHLKALKCLREGMGGEVSVIEIFAEKFSAYPSDRGTEEELVDTLTRSSQNLQVIEASHARVVATCQMLEVWLRRTELFLQGHYTYLARRRLLSAMLTFARMELQRIEVRAFNWDEDPDVQKFDSCAQGAYDSFQAAMGMLKNASAASEDGMKTVTSLIDSATEGMEQATTHYLAVQARFSASNFTAERRETTWAQQLELVTYLASSISSEAKEFSHRVGKLAAESGGLSEQEVLVRLARLYDISKAKAVHKVFDESQDAIAAAASISASRDLNTAMASLSNVLQSTLATLDSSHTAVRHLTMRATGAFLSLAAGKARDEFFSALASAGDLPSAGAEVTAIENLYQRVLQERVPHNAVEFYNKLMKNAFVAEQAALNSALVSQAELAQKSVDDASRATAFDTVTSQLAMRIARAKVLAQATIEEIRGTMERALDLEVPLDTIEGKVATYRLKATMRRADDDFAELTSSYKQLSEADTIEDTISAAQTTLAAHYSVMEVASKLRAGLFNALILMHGVRVAEPSSGTYPIMDAAERAAACSRAASLEGAIAAKRGAAAKALANAADKFRRSLLVQLHAEAVVVRRTSEFVTISSGAFSSRGGTAATQKLDSIYECLSYLEEINGQYEKQLEYIQVVVDVESSLASLGTESDGI